MAHAHRKHMLPEPEKAIADIASKPSQSLGKWIDNLLGDKKARNKAAIKAAERRKFFAGIPR